MFMLLDKIAFVTGMIFLALAGLVIFWYVGRAHFCASVKQKEKSNASTENE